MQPPTQFGVRPASDETCDCRHQFEPPSGTILAPAYQEHTREPEPSSRALVPYRHDLPDKSARGATAAHVISGASGAVTNSSVRRDSVPRAHGKLADDDTHWQDYLDERNSAASQAPREGAPRASSRKRSAAELRTSKARRDNRTRLAELLGGKGDVGRDLAKTAPCQRRSRSELQLHTPWHPRSDVGKECAAQGGSSPRKPQHRERILIEAEVTGGGLTGTITELKRSIIRI